MIILLPCALYMIAVLTIHLLVLHAFHIFLFLCLPHHQVHCPHVVPNYPSIFSSNITWESYSELHASVWMEESIPFLLLTRDVYLSICLPTIYSCLFPFLLFLINLNSVTNGTISSTFHPQCLLHWLTHSGCLVNICCKNNWMNTY